jgi:hypothetical protein
MSCSFYSIICIKEENGENVSLEKRRLEEIVPPD